MEVQGTLFFLSVNGFMGAFSNTLLVFQGERPVFLREYANKMYRVFPYFLAKIIVDTPMLIISPAVGALITYWVLDLHNSFQGFMGYLIAQVLVHLVASAIGYFISAIFENETTAMGLAPSMVMPMVLFGGFLANNDNLPGFLKWF